MEFSRVQVNAGPERHVAAGCRDLGTFWAPRRVKGVMADFDQFVAAYVDDLLRTAHLIVWDEGEAEDLVQECLLKVARRWPRISQMERPRAYARRILVNLALKGARGRAQHRRELEPGEPTGRLSVSPARPPSAAGARRGRLPAPVR